MGWTRTKVRHKISQIRMWNRLIQMPEETLTKKVFNWDYEIGSNWSRDIKDILYEINIQEDFVMKRVC